MTHLWDVLTAAVGERTTLYLPWHDETEYHLGKLVERAEWSAGQVVAELGGRVPRRLGVLMGNGEPWVRAVFTTLRLDASVVPLPLPAGLSAAEAYVARLARTVTAADLDAILVDRSVGVRVIEAVDAAVGVPLIDISEPDRMRPPDCELTGARPAVIQFTSGSTSAPKGVVLSHDNVIAGLSAITDGLGWVDSDVFGLWLPLFHDMGLFSTLCALARGSSVCLWRPTDFLRRPVDWLRGFAASPSTVLAAPNFFYDYMVRAAGSQPLDGIDLSGWRLACNGAEPVQRRTLVAFEEVFGPYGLRDTVLNPVYGMAEATLIVTGPDPASRWRSVYVDRDHLAPGERIAVVADDAPEARALVACGGPAPGIRLRIADEAIPLDDGVVGEVQITGPSVTAGYLDLPAEAQPYTSDGWLRTGDLGFRHDGQLHIVGRRKDMVTVRGQNYYAEDVEEVVRSAAGADGRRVVAIPWTDSEKTGADDLAGEWMVVLWETSAPQENAVATAEVLRQAVVRTLGLDAVRVVPVRPSTIPHTSSGKVRRSAARRQCLDGDLLVQNERKS